MATRDRFYLPPSDEPGLVVDAGKRTSMGAVVSMDSQSTMVVVFDGSPDSLEELRRATVACDETGSTLDVALTTDVRPWSRAFGLAGGWDGLGLEEELLRELRRELTAAIADTPRRLDVRSRVVDGREARTLRHAHTA